MKILATNGMSKKGEIIIQSAGFEILTVKVAQEQLEDYILSNSIDAILVNNTLQIEQELIDVCSSLKLVGSYSANTDNIDVEYAKNQGLHIISAENAIANSVAELVFAHLFGLVRNLHQSNREMPLEGDYNFKGLHKQYKGVELQGKTIGLIGMEATAIATAKIALGLGMKVVFSNYEPKSVSIPINFFDGQGVEFTFEALSLEEVLAQADFISLHTTTQSGYVLSAIEFEKMKEGVGIINCTHGDSVDEVSMLSFIEKGVIKYAGLDVFENQNKPDIQLLMNSNLSLSPNIASNTFDADDRIGVELANQVVALL